MSTLILASASPRRADILRWAGIDFEIDPASIDEKRLAEEAPLNMAKRLAESKALAKSSEKRLSLGADTIVFLGERIFEKPSGLVEAASHLASLSGKSHQVVTAFALAKNNSILHSEAVISQVSFRPLSASMIEKYVASKEGLDKAGAYGLQGLGGFLVEEIKGSYTSVVGLPLSQLITALNKINS